MRRAWIGADRAKMKLMLRTPGFWICAAILTTTAAAVAAAQVSSQPDKGEQLMNGSCTSCHDLRPIQTQALDSEGWNGVVTAMVDKGAQIDKSDIPPLVEYLTRNHGPLPEGNGKKILLTTCTVCHDLLRVKRTAATREEWEDTLGAMLNEGAMLSEQDFPVLLNYLARNFRSQ
jgi:cytochrome c5